MGVCHDTEVVLSQVKTASKKHANNVKDIWYQMLWCEGVATAYKLTSTLEGFWKVTDTTASL
jgi:hypothetical protein